MEEIKKLFSHSKDTVVFIDHDFNILWSNKEKSIFSEYSGCCRQLFDGIPQPLKSGKYELRHSGLIIECSVIDYSDRGIYVLTTEEDDLLMSFLGKEYIQKFFENQSGAMRHAFSGIISSNSELRRILAESENYDSIKYLERSAVNSCKIMRFAAVMTELMRYTDGSIASVKFDLADMLGLFTENSQRVFERSFERISGCNIRFECDYERGLYICADPQRLEGCLLALAQLANNREKENNIIKISAVKAGGSISLTFAPDSSGTDQNGGIFSKHEYLYNSDEYKIDLLLIKTFCKRFGCTLYIRDEANNAKSFSIKIPFCSENMPFFDLQSKKTTYDEQIYTKYHFFYSELI